MLFQNAPTPWMTRTVIAAEPVAPLARPGTRMAVYDSRLKQVGYIFALGRPGCDQSARQHLALNQQLIELNHWSRAKLT